MKRVKTKACAIATSLTLAAALGLAACGNASSSASSSSSSSAETPASAQDPSAAKGKKASEYQLEKAWYGSTDNLAAYYFEGANKQTGAVLLYHGTEGTYDLWIGKMETTDTGQKITDAESGEILEFSVSPADSDGISKLKTSTGTEANIVSMNIDEVGMVLDTISTYASKVGEPPKTMSAAELGGEYLVKINTEGLGQIAFSQNGTGLDFGDSAFTHANAGDTITLTSKPKTSDAKFIKWTKDGADYSTDPEITVTIEGNVEYVAVYTYGEA